MIIHFNPDWRIRSDPYNWIIEKRRMGGAKERWNAVGWQGESFRALPDQERRAAFLVKTMPTRIVLVVASV